MTMTPQRLTEIRDIILRAKAEHPHGNHNPTHIASREEVLELVEALRWRHVDQELPDSGFHVVAVNHEGDCVVVALEITDDSEGLGEEYWSAEGGDLALCNYPYWMPLPALPEQAHGEATPKPDMEPAHCRDCRGTGYVSNHKDSLPCARCGGTGAEPPPGTAAPVTSTVAQQAAPLYMPAVGERVRVVEVAPGDETCAELLHELCNSLASFIAAIDSSSADVSAYLEQRLAPLVALIRTDERVRIAVDRIGKDARQLRRAPVEREVLVGREEARSYREQCTAETRTPGGGGWSCVLKAGHEGAHVDTRGKWDDPQPNTAMRVGSHVRVLGAPGSVYHEWAGVVTAHEPVWSMAPWKVDFNGGKYTRNYPASDLQVVGDPQPEIRIMGFYSQAHKCCACKQTLVLENFRIADGCPCNSARGVNHGLVPILTCTCVVCDPKQTGSTRYGELTDTDTGIIRAAEGMTLERIDYEIVTVDDLTPNLKPGDIARPERLDCVRRLATAYHNRFGWLFLDGGPSTWVTAVRRIEAQPKSVASNNPTSLGEVWIGETTTRACTCNPSDTGPTGHMLGCPSIEVQPERAREATIERPPSTTLTGEQYQQLLQPPHTCATDNHCLGCEAMKARWARKESAAAEQLRYDWERLTRERDEAVAEVAEIEAYAADDTCPHSPAHNGSNLGTIACLRKQLISLKSQRGSDAAYLQEANTERDEARAQVAKLTEELGLVVDSRKNNPVWKRIDELAARTVAACDATDHLQPSERIATEAKIRGLEGELQEAAESNVQLAVSSQKLASELAAWSVVGEASRLVLAKAENYFEEHGAEHEIDGCPEDDTCECFSSELGKAFKALGDTLTVMGKRWPPSIAKPVAGVEAPEGNTDGQ